MTFEAHITIEPICDDRINVLKTLAENENFKVAKLYMGKDRTGTDIRSDKDTFMTGHSDDYSDLCGRMERLMESLVYNGFEVWRHKVEYIMVDSKFGTTIFD